MAKVNMIRGGRILNVSLSILEYRAARFQCAIQAATSHALAVHLCKAQKTDF